LHRCLECQAAYLDPRPARQSVGLIYENYYTHASSPPAMRPQSRTGRIGRWKERLRNGYLSERFGLPLSPRFKFAGAVVPLLFPRHRIAFDTSVRHLPLPQLGARLLDVGCGGGDFLASARSVGWDVTGIEIDPVAAAIAAAQGIPVIGKPLADAGLAAASFDAVTMNHVIEHLHDPRAALAEIHRILKPDGLLWLSTPNVDSPLRRQLGRIWRGFEAPRHLVLFGMKALRKVIRDSGFTRLSWPRTYPLTRWMFAASPNPARGTEIHLRLLEVGSILTQRLSEQLVVLAMKPNESRR